MNEQALNDAAGRELSPEELEGIQRRVRDAASDLEKMMPAAWAQMPPEQRARAAGELAQARHMDNVLAEQRRMIDRMTEQARNRR